MLIAGSVLLLLSIIFGAPYYYYKYSRSDTKASISKNPNYGLFAFHLVDFIYIAHLELYTPDQWEINKDSVTMDKLIGQGHFGQVYQGVLKLSEGALKPCAVKVNRVFIEIELFIAIFQVRTTHPTDLLQEASIMKFVFIVLRINIFVLFF